MFSRVCLSTKGVSISDPMSLVGMSKRVSTHPHPLDMGPGGDGVLIPLDMGPQEEWVRILLEC